MYSVVKYARRVRDAYIAAAVMATGIAITVLTHWSDNPLAFTAWYVAMCSAVWLAGYTVRNRRLYVAGLEERAATLEREREHLARIAVADERSAIARELHDIVAHSLAVMIVQADGGRYTFDTEPDKAREALATVAATGREALADMSRLVEILRRSDTEPDDPERSPVDLGRLDELADRARGAGLLVELSTTGDLAGLPPSVQATAYRLAQEGLTNALRHAGPGATVTLTLVRKDDELNVSIVDDGGPGRRPAPATGDRVGHGLIGMRERVAVHQGRLTAGPRLAGGWEIDATLAVPDRPEGQ